MNETSEKTEDRVEGVSDVQPLLVHYAQVGREFLANRGIDVSQTAKEIDELFEGTIHDAYLRPVLEQVKESGAASAAEHARRIGVNRSTTSGWWNLYAQKKSSRIGQPNLKTFLYTLAAFDVEPIETLPLGTDVTIRAWRKCISYIDQEKLGNAGTHEISGEELVCLHLVWNSEEWKNGQYDDAATCIILTLRSSVIDTLNAINGVVRRWFIPGTIAVSLLKTKWLLET